ncbi:MAG: hypothetical protein IKP10_05800 [Clostridia bacterium]|nr:hypothetical protein [Clostridia bacterium]
MSENEIMNPGTEPTEEAAEEILEKAAEETQEETQTQTQEPAGTVLGAGLQPAALRGGATLLGAGNSAAAQEDDEEYEPIPVAELDTVKLGRQGENGTQTVQIDCSGWLENIPVLSGCQLIVAAIRPKENTVYLPEVTVSSGVISWEITGTDTAFGGWGRAEVRAVKDGAIKKSKVFRTRIEPALENSAVTPANPPDWAVEIMDAVEASAASAQAAQDAAESITNVATDAEANTYFGI